MSPYSFNYEALDSRLDAVMEKYKDLDEDAEIILTKMELFHLTAALTAGSFLNALSDSVKEAHELFIESLEGLEK